MKKVLEVIKENRVYIFPWAILATLTVIMAFGLSYAYFDFVVDSSEESSMRVTATDLHVSLSNPTVNLNDIAPIYDEYKNTQANTFTFSMSNTSRKLAGCVDLYLTFNSISESLKISDMKWMLTNTSTGTVTSGYFSDILDNRLLIKENENIPKNTTYNYTLLIWLSFSTSNNQTPISGSMNAKITSIAYGGACAATQVTTYTIPDGNTETEDVFTAPEEGYYRVEIHKPISNSGVITVRNINLSGEIFLAKGEKLNFSMNSDETEPTMVMCFINDSTGLCGTSSGQDELSSSIMHVNSTSSFVSGYAGANAPIYINGSAGLSNGTLHPTGKFFLNVKKKLRISRENNITITYLGKYQERTNTALNNVRYIKDCINGNTTDTTNAWVELQAIKNGVNIAYKKNITTTGTLNTSVGTGILSSIVDGDISSSRFAQVNSGNKCVTVDLGRTYDLDEIAVWHYYSDGRVYNNNITSVSSNNSSWTEVINYTDNESEDGKRVNAYGKSYSLTLEADQGTTGLSDGDTVRFSKKGIKAQDFYVVSTNSATTVLLAKYNLLVGRTCTSSSTSSCSQIDTSTTGYGLQSEDAGYTGTYPAVGVVPFSGSSTSYGYWYDSTNSTIKSQYGASYNVSNIYDTTYTTAPDWSAAFSNDSGNANYSIAYYVEEYVDRLGINGTGRLLIYTEATSMTQAKRTNGVYYWLGSAYGNNYVWSVGSGGSVSVNDFASGDSRGVRPVIVISTSDISA